MTRANKLENFSEAIIRHESDVLVAGAPTWTPPPCKTFKVNKEVAVDRGSGMVTLDMV